MSSYGSGIDSFISRVSRNSGLGKDTVFKLFEETQQDFTDELDFLRKDMTIQMNQKFKDLLADAFIKLKSQIQEIVPVRSGKYLDLILTSLRLDAVMNFEDRKDTPLPNGSVAKAFTVPPSITLKVHYVKPNDRPILIDNPRHSGQMGYGERYKPLNHIKNRTIVKPAGIKSAVYILNDMASSSVPSLIIDARVTELLAEMERQIQQKWNNLFTLMSRHASKGVINAFALKVHKKTYNL